MTTDITELAQRVERIISDMKLKHGVKDTYAPVMKWDEFLALVEALEKAQQRISQLESRTVKLPKPKNSDQGWKIDPEFINKVQGAIGYDDTCECWEGTPSMELVEAVLLAAAGIKVEDE